MRERNAGVTADPLFVGATRPPMRFGVTYAALLVNLVVTMEAFLLTKNLLVLLIAVPIHGVCALLCARDARYFDLLLVWLQTRPLGYLSTLRYWQGASYSPLALEAPNRRGVRRSIAIVRLAQGERPR